MKLMNINGYGNGSANFQPTPEILKRRASRRDRNFALQLLSGWIGLASSTSIFAVYEIFKIKKDLKFKYCS